MEYNTPDPCDLKDLFNLGYDSAGLLDLEESIDIKISPFPEPMSPYGPPSKGDFTGNYQFEVALSGETMNRKKNLYSTALNRVYLCMMTEMPVQFQWNWNALQDRKLYVRATLVMARNEHQEARVLRCSIHKELHDASNKEVPDNVIPHVLRSARCGPDVFYCGNEQDKQSWLSVVFEAPMRPPDGVTALQHVYMFCCKHSCISGINRRPVEVLFTLEDLEGNILGRSSLGVRVCSCPKRDLEKDEDEYRQNTGGPPTKKKRLQPPNQLQPHHNSNVNSTMQAMQGLYHTGSLLARHIPPDNSAAPLLRNLLQDLKNQLDGHK